MSDTNSSIHDFDANLICEYFLGLERQGPGSKEITLKALSFIDGLTKQSRIADIGCGSGGQTVTLAQNAKGDIAGIDLYPPFIERFQENAKRFHLEDRMHGVVGSMEALPFTKGELDLIWAEGAIYNIGFEKGLNEWGKFLKKGGYIAVSEASWFTEKRPEEIDTFWNNAYPEIDTIPAKVAILQKAGFIPVSTFILPETCWTDHFYKPQVPVQKAFLKKYAGNQTAIDYIGQERREAELYAQYKEFYGYVFYIGKKISYI